MQRELTSFVGRQQEAAALVAHLRDGAALITLVGPGGVGKTRLATHAAAQMQHDHLLPACLVSLEGVTELAEELAPTALASLGVRQQTSVPAIETLVAALRDVELVLVLDNCEHVIEASARLAYQLLLRCPRLHILATSREPLGVPGELSVAVQPLALPAANATVALISESEAVQLFVTRAITAQASFNLTPTLAEAVGEICRLVDGVPLAIELAAARAKTMTVVEIRSRLTDSLGLLSGGPRVAPPRHQSLGAAIDWSYSVLTEPERVLLRRLAVFSGSFSSAASEEVCSDEQLRAEQVSDVLDRLISRSVVSVTHEDQGTTRFVLLETTRRYLLTRLAAAGEHATFRARHRDWCIGVVERVPAELLERHQLERICVESANVRDALNWTLASDQMTAASRLAVGLAPLWLTTAKFEDARALLTIVLQSTAPARQAALAGIWAARFANLEGAYPLAEELANRALAFARAAGDQSAITRALGQLGDAALGRGELARAAELYATAQTCTDTPGPVGGFRTQATTSQHVAAVDPLSDREREVVALLVRGLNNRGVADELVIATKTVEAHISHILTKLNLTSRMQIVSWAYDRGLVQPNCLARDNS